MIVPHSAATLAIILFLLPAQSGHAQGLFRRLAEQAVTEVRSTPERQAEEAARGQNVPPAANAAPQPAVSGRPAKAAPSGHFTSSLSAPPGFDAVKAAYDKFGEVICNECEGGIDLGGRPTFSHDQFSGQYEERARRAGHWPVGHIHRWETKGTAGSLTVVAEEQVDGFRCRRILYKLVRGKATAERPGLACWGLASRESSVENWHEIY
jgi:hypothetical protein